MGLRDVAGRLGSWGPWRWAASRWKWLAIGLLAVYVLNPQVILEVSGPRDGCRPGQERRGAGCFLTYAPRLPVDTDLVHYPAKQRFALYLSTVQVRLIDVDLASGRFEGFGIPAQAVR